MSREETPLSITELGRYALLLSGVEEDELGPYMDRLQSIINQLKTYPKLETSEREKGDIVLQFMHDTVSTQYRQTQTRFDVYLQRGIYNCVSSSVLYTILARSVGLTVRTVYTSDHVFCKIKAPEGNTDVETTNPYGYNPGEKKEFHDKFGRTGYTYVPPGNYRKRTEDDDKRLLSFILQNRISAFERAKQYRKAVPLAVDRFTILGTEKAREAMIKEFVNYISILNARRNVEDAFTFLDKVESTYGDNPKFDKITSVLINNKLTQYVNNNQFDEAVSFLQTKKSNDVITREQYGEFREKVEDRRIYVNVHSLPVDQAIRYVENRHQDNRISESRYQEYLSYLYVKKARKQAEEKGWGAAIEVARNGLDKLPRSNKLKEAVRVFRHNYAAQIHNRFARLFNNRKYEEAKHVVQAGLEEIPGNSILQRDLNMVERTLSQQ